MVLLALWPSAISFADGVIIPGSIKVNEFKEKMKQKGYDLSGSDEAYGEVENNGTKMKIITYKPVTEEELNIIKETAFETVRK